MPESFEANNFVVTCISWWLRSCLVKLNVRKPKNGRETRCERNNQMSQKSVHAAT